MVILQIVEDKLNLFNSKVCNEKRVLHHCSFEIISFCQEVKVCGFNETALILKVVVGASHLELEISDSCGLIDEYAMELKKTLLGSLSDDISI